MSTTGTESGNICSYTYVGCAIKYQSVLEYAVTDSNDAATVTLTTKLKACSSPALHNDFGFNYVFSAGSASNGTVETTNGIRGGSFPVGTTPQDVSTSAYSPPTCAFTVQKTHSSQTVTATGRIYYGKTQEYSTATKSLTIGAKTQYTVSYNLNGGTGTVPNQTKWHNESLTLSTVKPTRTGYTFQGWSTTQNGTVKYASGATYTGNAALVLYAAWKAANPPSITGVSCERCLANGTIDGEGTYAKVTAKYSADTSGNSSNQVTTANLTLGSATNTTTLNAASGTYSVVVGTFADLNATYSGNIVFRDSNGRSSTVSIRLNSTLYPIDVLYRSSDNSYSVGLLCTAADIANRVTIGGNVNSNGEWIYFGNGTNASLYTHTTGRNGRVMAVKGVDGYGASIELGAGGLTIVGGGESAASLYSEYVTNGTVSGGDEQLWLGADSEVDIFTNCNSVTNGIINGEHKFRFSNAGNIILGGALYFGDVNDPDDGTYRAHLNATDSAIYLTGDQTASGVKAQIRILNATGKIGTRVYDGSAWGSWHDLDPSSIVVGADIVLYPTSKLIRFVLTSGGNFRLDKRSSESVAWSDSSVEHFYAPMGKASTASHTANTVYAAPNGSAGTANFRALVVNDLPSYIPHTRALASYHYNYTHSNIDAVTTKPTAVNTAGWNYEYNFTGGPVHAWGIIRVQSTAIQTKLADGMYWNSTPLYVALPIKSSLITSVQFGHVMGGSSGWGAYAASSGATSDWTGATFSLRFNLGRPTTAASGTWWIPVDVRYMGA